jgi:t-SNARE complex subunit (syntaxin)
MAASASASAAPEASVRIVGTEVGNDGTKVFTQYVIEATRNGSTITRKRRYKE